MYSHSFQTTLSINGKSTISGGVAETGGAIVGVDTILPANSNNLQQNVAFTLASVQSLALLASAAMTIRVNVPGTNAAQTVSMAGPPTAGTFPITIGGQTAAGLAWNTTATLVQAALQALSSVGSGNLTATGGPFPGTPIVLTYAGTLGLQPQPTAATSSSGLTGGTVAVASTTTGVAPDKTINLVAGVPYPWDRSCAYFPNPFPTDVTTWFVTTTVATNFQASILSA